MIATVARWWIVIVVVACFLGVGVIGVLLMPNQPSAVTEEEISTLSDSLRAILQEAAADTVRITGTADLAYWNRRVNHLEEMDRRIFRLLSIIAQRQERGLCWSSNNRDYVCRRQAGGMQDEYRHPTDGVSHYSGSVER